MKNTAPNLFSTKSCESLSPKKLLRNETETKSKAFFFFLDIYLRYWKSLWGEKSTAEVPEREREINSSKDRSETGAKRRTEDILLRHCQSMRCNKFDICCCLSSVYDRIHHKLTNSLLFFFTVYEHI